MAAAESPFACVLKHRKSFAAEVICVEERVKHLQVDLQFFLIKTQLQNNDNNNNNNNLLKITSVMLRLLLGRLQVML